MSNVVDEITERMRRASADPRTPPKKAAAMRRMVAAASAPSPLVRRLAEAKAGFIERNQREPSREDLEGWAQAEIDRPGSMAQAVAETERIDRAMNLRPDVSLRRRGDRATGMPTLTKAEARAELARRGR